MLFSGKHFFIKPSFACCNSRYPKALSDSNFLTLHIFSALHKGYTIPLLTDWILIKYCSGRFIKIINQTQKFLSQPTK
jgi:hypothetical protein